jgi:enamine deaminase RidA (YjgF/YER057c/UK114 family)
MLVAARALWQRRGRMKKVAMAMLSLVLGCASAPPPPAAAPAPPSAPAAPGKTVYLVDAHGAAGHERYHFAPVVRAGDLVIVSGIPALAGAGGAEYESNLRRMFDAAKRRLEAAGASFADVVEITTFHADTKDTAAFARDFEVFSKVHAENFTAPYPAWTAIGNAVLLAPGAAVEMRLVAVVGAGKSVVVVPAAR